MGPRVDAVHATVTSRTREWLSAVEDEPQGPKGRKEENSWWAVATRANRSNRVMCLRSPDPLAETPMIRSL